MSLQSTINIGRGNFTLDLELSVEPGEVVALLGPNGAGKSTVLRALAGLLPIDAGSVQLNGVLLENATHRVPPHQRSIGVVFQDYLLFPHLTALENVAFGPRARGMGKAEARAKALVLLQRVGADDLAESKPGKVSGGQAQRIALARALATEPELLLLDEPMAALDARTKLLIRSELRRHLQSFAGAAIVVTHDPIDAAVLADRLVVIEHGRVVQQGTPAEVARQPRTDYVARLVGLNVLVGTANRHLIEVGAGQVHAAATFDGPAYAAFRPAAVSLYLLRPQGSPRNLWQGRIIGLEPHGEGVRVEVDSVPSPGSSILAEVTQAAVAELDLMPGQQIWAAVKASDVEVYPA